MLTNPVVVIPGLAILGMWIVSRLPVRTKLHLAPRHRQAAIDYHTFRDRHATKKAQDSASAPNTYGPLSSDQQEKFREVRSRLDSLRKAA